MSPRQPVVSGQRLIKALEAEGWKVARQRGSHVRLKKAGHRLALVVPLHKSFAKAPSPASCGMPISVPMTCVAC